MSRQICGWVEIEKEGREGGRDNIFILVNLNKILRKVWYIAPCIDEEIDSRGFSDRPKVILAENGSTQVQSARPFFFASPTPITA